MPTPETRTILLLTGMKDNRCREAVTEALQSVHGVSQVYVNLIRARATIVHAANCVREQLLDAVRSAGLGVTAADGSSRPGSPPSPGEAGTAAETGSNARDRSTP
jgi:cation transport ATPase